MLPYISFNVIASRTFQISCLAKVRQEFPDSIYFSQARRLNFHVGRVLVRINAFNGVDYIFFFTRSFNRINNNVIIVGQLRYKECKFYLGRINKRVTVFRVDFPIKFRLIEYYLNLFGDVRDSFNIGATRAFTVNFNCCKCSVITRRTVVFFSPGSPSKRRPLCFNLFCR